MACFSSGAYYLLLLLLIPSVHNKDTLQNFDRADITHPASDFTRHTLVKPRIYHGREKRQISSTKEEDGVHSSHLLVEIEVDNKDLVLDLSLNKGLLSKGFFHRYQENGLDKVYKPEAQDVELCQYSGKVRGEPNSWVALSTCEGLSGVIYDGREMHYIEKNGGLAKPNLEDSHFLYKHSDLAENNKTCGYEGTEGHDHDHRHDKSNRILRYKRHIENSELVRGPYNANKESKYVELVLVIDNREYKELGENRHNVELHCKTIANIINGLYSPLNIFIALVGVVIWTEHDEISFSSNGDTTLTNFLHYRREKLIKDHPNDNAQLLSKFNFDNGVVGKALKGPICTYEYSGGVNTDHSPVIGLVATTVAHEMGHNFGMEHDTNECKCPDARCIMAPSSSSEAPTHWSSCSLNYLLLAFTHGMDYCLKNKPIALFDSPVCGNGFVEPGEQCDCGLAEHCDNTCCNATTCMLYSNASCATGECCDLTTCRPKTAGSLCRSADYECDLPEYCTGQSEYCPPDIFKMDTESCDNGKAYCYHGFCRTRTDQCKLLWGETGKSSDEQCYRMNTKGTRHGNCGYNKFNQSFSKCSNESILCGMLHCRHLNERLEFGMESVAILSQSFINSKGTIIPCRTAIVDLGINQVDPGLAPDGASCGDGKMCVNQRCMNVESLRLGSGLICPHNCNGNGWCNSLGHCHCKEQFAPPYCEFAGHGGSEDSGPASDPNKNQAFVQALFIIFLGIIPAAALAAWCLMQAKRTSMCQTRAKSLPTMVKSPGKPRPSGTGGGAFLEVTKRTDDNHSLLRGDSPPPIGFRSEFFGKCNGFTISPVSKVPPEPVRAAPPVPVVAPTPQAAKIAKPAPNVPTTAKKQECEPMRNAPPPPTAPPIAKGDKAPSTARSMFLKGPLRVPSFKQRSLSNALSHINQASAAPALPPPNPGSNARPIISAPVLEASTCTAKELLSPLRNAPKVPIRPVVVIAEKEKVEEEKKEVIEKEKIEVKKVSKENSALTRITSFLKPSDKKPQQSNSNQVKANKIDKTQLRTMEISNPILQTHIEVPTNALPVDTEATKAVVMRAQSMRGPTVTKRPAIPTFGSMRQSSGSKRPVSIPCGTRPKSPPPPRPPVSDVTLKSDEYDDCLNKKAPMAGSRDETSPISGDNIYAVIEDSPVSPESVKSAKNDAESGDSMGLLCEIVSEIQNRNFDSIYSTSTLARKKKEEEEKRRLAKERMYENTTTSPIYKSPESNSPVYKSPESSEYSNMSNVKSSASSTSSGGYIHPSAVNKPIVHSETSKKPPNDTSSVSKTTTFKTANTPFVRPQGPVPTHKQIDSDKKIKTPPSPKRPQINRQVTPPNLRTRKPSPTRPSPPSTTTGKNRSITNSPDLVTSCNSKSVVKQPDVLNGGPTVKKPAPSVKPNVNGLPKGPPAKIVNKAVSFKTVQEKSGAAGRIAKTNSDAGKSVPAGLKNVSKQNSNVASLQQKFENKGVKSTA